MSNNIEQKVIDYLLVNNILTLATVSSNGTPVAHTVTYVSEGATVYFVTDKNSRKAQNILNNSNVAYTVDKDLENFSKVQGIQMEGKATFLSEKEEIEKAGGLMIKKFPQMANIPPNPNMVFIKIEPAEGYFLDNTISFGHRDKLVF